MKSGLLSDLGLALKAYRETFVFRGRSTRTEMFALLIVASLIGMASRWVLDLLCLPINRFDTSLGIGLALALYAAPFLPMFALLARVAHDFGWPGWPSALVGGTGAVLSVWHGFHIPGINFYPDWMEFVRAPGVMGFFATLFWAPTRGINRFGADPRLDAADAQIVGQPS